MMMNWHCVDMEGDPRKAHFDYFRTLANPMVGVTAEVDVTDLVAFCRASGASFYLAFMHAAALAADGVPELRRRILDGRVVEYDECPTSHVEPAPDGSYGYCTLRHHMPWAEFLPYGEAARKAARENPSIEEDEDVLSMVFVTCVPWLHYTQLIQPTAGGDESNPRISWGKYAPDWRGRLMMPVTLMAHHGLVDGVHIARFYERLREQVCREQAAGNREQSDG